MKRDVENIKSMFEKNVKMTIKGELKNYFEGNVVNQITVDDNTSHWARVALDRMLALPGVTADTTAD